MAKNLTLREHASAAKLLHRITGKDPIDCSKIVNDPESDGIICLLEMLGQKDNELTEHEIMERIRRASFELLELRK